MLPTGSLVALPPMQVGETHDTFIQEDPILKRTLLYAAGGFTSGFYVWDITAPTEPVLLAEWDPTPECGNDWYAHTIDVTVRNGKRVVTMPNELIDFFGEQGDDPDNCGSLSGPRRPRRADVVRRRDRPHEARARRARRRRPTRRTRR